jgi:predicted RNase H-like nuclease (RuvC/YqgF family)
VAEKPEWEYAGHQVCRAEIERLKRDAREVCAPRLEQQAKEIERLRAELAEFTSAARFREMNAEVRVLRAVLQHISDLPPCMGCRLVAQMDPCRVAQIELDKHKSR